MIYRLKKPNQNLWNGLGGKLETGETPEGSIKREVMEEAGLSLDTARSLYFSGIVSWNKKTMTEHEGMYAFIADFPTDVDLVSLRETEEGRIDWKPIEWVCNTENKEVVPNIPQFLPKMLEYNVPLHYECYYENGVLKEIDVSSLPEGILNSSHGIEK